MAAVEIVEPTLMAFWEYDVYPFLKCGTIAELKQSGLVVTHEYGKGMSFRPVMILPEEAGQCLKTQLDELECEYRGSIKELNNLFQQRANLLTKPFAYSKK